MTPLPVVAALALAAALAGPPQDAAAQPDLLPSRRLGPGPVHKAVVPAAEAGLLDGLRERGALVAEHDYGAFAVVLVDERPLGGRPGLLRAGLDLRDELDLVVFDGYALDGTRPEETLAALDPAERIGAADGAGPLDPTAGLYLVQYAAPPRDRWLGELAALGVRFRQPLAFHAYVVELAPDRVAALEALAAARPEVQYVGVYQPAFRMTPDVRAAAREADGEPRRVTVQLVDGPGIRAALADVAALAEEVLLRSRVGPYVNVRARIDPAYLRTLAAHPRVFAIEAYGVPARNDERQGQSQAGNVDATGPTAPGYLAWLASKGFDSTQFGSFSVNVVDDATSLTGHPDLDSARVDFALNPTSQSGAQSGHGFLNAHIVAGYNDQTGSTYEDVDAFNYGLGIAPWAHVGSTAIFGPGGLNPTSYEDSAYVQGARFSTNSWSFQTTFGNPIPDYDSNAQEYDFIVRDARSGAGGNQEYMVLFSAGNYGSGANTVSTPATAKNILTVGASENDRPFGTDGCGVGNSGANDIDDVISFSSRGPVNSSGGDGRWKPEIVSQGTHVQAGVPQSNYGGGGVCDMFFPPGSTLYGWSSGTSHSTPGVAGGAALVRQHFLNQSLPAPSPAMVKAVLVNSSEYLVGVGANDTLPSDSQGMGRLNLGRTLDGTPQMRVDQGVVLGSTGQTSTLLGDVASTGLPFRVTLVWTDAPGPTSGAPFVNDLDLTVDVGGTTYRGNVFSGADSVAGGTADFRNNTESVFLPPGQSGPFVVTVTAATIAGDGVPGNGDATDQDFALFVHNGVVSSGSAPVALFSGAPLSGLAPLSVDFTDLSAGDVTGWSWDFGDSGTSSAQNPTHVYTTPGTYTVSLTASGPGGSDVETKVDYVTVSAPPPPGIGDGSFEAQTAGTAPGAPWSVLFGTGHVVSPSGTTTDGGMPTDGAQWCELAANSTDGATPPSNPGGVTSPPVGGAGIEQDFTYPAGQTVLEFDAVFLRNENANEATYNDWMSVDVTDGATTWNLAYLDTFTPTPSTSAKHGLPMTAVQSVSVDLAVLFPSSTPATLFTLTAQVGNAVDDFQPSLGYVDDFRLPASPPIAEFGGSPLSGNAPLAVDFTDLSGTTGGGPVDSWSWDFGDSQGGTAQDPTHVYTQPGTYTVSLTVSGPGGADVETKLDYVTVTGLPPAGTSYGSSTPGSLGAPTMRAESTLVPGTALDFVAGNLPPGTPVFFPFGVKQQSPSLDLSNGILLNVALPVLFVEARTTDATGEARVEMLVPSGLAGISLHSQGIAFDGVAGDQFASSEGVQVPMP